MASQKNVILLVLDQFPFDVLGLVEQVEPSATPFMDQLFREHFHATQLFSQGPYTEAALPAFLSSTPTLAYGGYLKALKGRPLLLPEVFQRLGYRTLNYHYQYSEQSSHKRGFSDLVYADFNLLYYWTLGVRLEWYGALYRRGDIGEQEYTDLVEILDSCFDDWHELNVAAQQHDASAALLRRMLGAAYVPDEFERILTTARTRYERDKRQYLTDIFSGNHNSLDAIKAYSEGVYRADYTQSLEAKRPLIRRTLLRLLFGERQVVRLLRRPDFWRRWWQLYREAVKRSPHWFPYLRSVIGALLAAFWECSGMPAARLYVPPVALPAEGFPSFFTLREHFGAWLDGLEKDQPFFAYIHAMDLHGDLYFSYDRSDAEIAQEFRMLVGYAQQAHFRQPRKRPLEYYLNARKVDEQVRRLVEDLKARRIWDNCLLVVTTDHGLYYPSRGKDVNLFRYFDEDSHLPFGIAGGGVSPQQVGSLASSLDIAPTILDFCGLNVPAAFEGKSMRDPHYHRDVVTMEYLGEGCPDMERRDKLLIARSEQYKLAYRLPPHARFEQGSVEAIFDVQHDPDELQNLKDADVDVSALLAVLRTRAAQMQ